MKEPDRVKLMKTLAWETKYRGKGKDPALIIYDTISKVIPGADENGAPEMSIFNDIRTKIRHAFKSADIGMHHVAKNGEGGMRGSSALIGDGDSIMTMDREKGSEELIMTAFKIKAAPDGWSMPINLKTVSTTGLQTSLVPVLPKGSREARGGDGFGGAQETGLQIVEGRKWPSKETCEKILNAIQNAASKKEPWSLSQKSRDYGRYAAARIKNAFGVDEDTANHMIRTWLNNDVLESWIYDSRNKKMGLRKKNSA